MGYETLKNIIDFNKEQEEIGKEEAMNPTECPWDGWTLNENSKGEKSCPICGRVFNGNSWR